MIYYLKAVKRELYNSNNKNVTSCSNNEMVTYEQNTAKLLAISINFKLIRNQKTDAIVG